MGYKLLFSLIICLGFLSVTFANESLIEVNDPATKKALEEFNRVKSDLVETCSASSEKDFKKITACMCKASNLDKLHKANKKKTAAFANLMERRPELKNEMIKIKGVFGNWYMNPDDVKEAEDINYLKRSLGCK